MSFYTSLRFYRPTPPPLITGPVLARFVADLLDSGAFVHEHDNALSVKFGQSIDQDEKDTASEEPIPDLPGVFKLHEIEWDIRVRTSACEVLQLLSAHDRPIYRAFMSLGRVSDAIVKALQTPRPDDQQPNLWLTGASLEVGPIHVSEMSKGPFAVGWISAGFGGNGYLWPWTARDLTDRAVALDALKPMTEICRTHFPVHLGYRGDGFRRGRLGGMFSRKSYVRRRMGDLWPFDRLDEPWDWYWGVSESG